MITSLIKSPSHSRWALLLLFKNINLSGGKQADSRPIGYFSAPAPRTHTHPHVHLLPRARRHIQLELFWRRRRNIQRRLGNNRLKIGEEERKRCRSEFLANGSTYWPMCWTGWIGQSTGQWVDLLATRSIFKTHLSRSKITNPRDKNLHRPVLLLIFSFRPWDLSWVSLLHYQTFIMGCMYFPFHFFLLSGWHLA